MYLGTIVNCETDVNSRISAATKVVYALNETFISKKVINKTIKVKVFIAGYIPIVISIWKWNVGDEREAKDSTSRWHAIFKKQRRYRQKHRNTEKLESNTNKQENRRVKLSGRMSGDRQTKNM